MRTFLPLFLAALSALAFHVSRAQTTLVSYNTNLTSGYVLPNGNPVMISESGALYSTNGTTAFRLSSSVLVSADSGSLTIYKGQLYFTGKNIANDIELWKTDGTIANTRQVKDIWTEGASSPDGFFVFNNLLYFTAYDAIHGRELWVSDGSDNNASIVTDINGNNTSSLSTSVIFAQNGGNVFFTATNNKKQKGLYTLTSSGISLVKNDLPGTINLIPGLTSASLHNKVVFTVDSTMYDFGTGGLFTTLGIWATDGTPAGTQLLHNFESTAVPSGFVTPVLFNDLLYFVYNDTTTSALWTTDGTAANTQLLKNFDIDPDNNGISGFNLLSSVVISNKLFFSGYSRAAGNEMWNTDGTTAGTKIFKDITLGEDGSGAYFLFNAGAYAGTDFNGNATGNFTYQQFYTPYKGKYYFTASDGVHGTELWATDGTAANTAMVKDINLNEESGLSSGANTAYYTSTGIYFGANNGSQGVEPWITDGTEDGTSLVADINKGNPDGSDPTYLFIYNNQLYLDANSDGQNSSLYKINGTTGTLPLRLLSFTAQKQPQSVLLNWVTTNEVNTSRFSVERSVDGLHFNEAGTLPALSGTAANKRYQFNDVTALQTGSSKLYYRLKMIDEDGKYVYSLILMAQLENYDFMVKLSPNPVRDQLMVTFSASRSERTILRITDANGRQLLQQVYIGQASAAIQQNIDVSQFAKGIYFIQIVTDAETKSQRFIKE